MQELFDLLAAAHKNNQVSSTVIGKAVNVQDDKCDVEREGKPTLFDVRFHVVEATLASKIIIKPKEGSYVLCGIIESLPTEAFIQQCSEIESVYVKVETTELLINAEGHKLSRGENQLLAVMNELIEQQKKHVQELMKVVVMVGTTPDYTALEQIIVDIETQKEKLNQILS